MESDNNNPENLRLGYINNFGLNIINANILQGILQNKNSINNISQDCKRNQNLAMCILSSASDQIYNNFENFKYNSIEKIKFIQKKNFYNFTNDIYYTSKNGDFEKNIDNLHTNLRNFEEKSNINYLQLIEMIEDSQKGCSNVKKYISNHPFVKYIREERIKKIISQMQTELKAIIKRKMDNYNIIPEVPQEIFQDNHSYDELIEDDDEEDFLGFESDDVV